MELQRDIMRKLAEANRRLCYTYEPLPAPPYWRAHNSNPKPERTGETVQEKPVRDESGALVARRVIRKKPGEAPVETTYPLTEEAGQVA